MVPTQRVLLCGHSLLFAGLQTSLAIASGLELQCVEAKPECLHERLSAWTPDVLILAQDALFQDLSLSILKDFPHMTLVGLDPEGNTLLVLSGKQQQAFSSADLIRLIDQVRRSPNHHFPNGQSSEY